MTYNVFGGTLNPAQSNPIRTQIDRPRPTDRRQVHTNSACTRYIDGERRDKIACICHPSGCTVPSGVVVVGGGGVCNRSQMRTSKCTCLIFGMSIVLDPG